MGNSIVVPSSSTSSTQSSTSSTSSYATSRIDYPSYLVLLPEYTYVRIIGYSRILKSLEAVHDNGMHVCIKIRLSSPSSNISPSDASAIQEYEEINQKLYQTIYTYNTIHIDQPLSLLPLKKILFNSSTSGSGSSNTAGGAGSIGIGSSGAGSGGGGGVISELGSNSYIPHFYVREFIGYNLYDRLMHIHPYMLYEDKLFITYQLLQCLLQLHHICHISHHDIKTENFLLTTYGYVYLTDFAFYKPIYLPADNPTLYTQYFTDTSTSTASSSTSNIYIQSAHHHRRNRCYIAPERFYTQSLTDMTQSMNVTTSAIHTTPQPRQRTTSNDANVNGRKSFEKSGGSAIDESMSQRMDIFSLGCVIGEIWLDGDPLFDLPTLLAYKEQKYDMSQNNKNSPIHKIESKMLQDMILHMIQLDSTKRSAIEEYIERYSNEIRLFPPYMKELYSMLQYISSTNCISPDHKIQYIYTQSTNILRIAESYNKIDNDVQNVKNESETRKWQNNIILPIITVLCSCLLNCEHVDNTVMCIELLTQYSEYLSDELRLARIIPYLIQCIQTDQSSSMIRIIALKSLSTLLSSISYCAWNERNIVSQYVLPALSRIPIDVSESVRVTYADVLHIIAHAGKRILMAANPSSNDNYDHNENYRTTGSKGDVDGDVSAASNKRVNVKVNFNRSVTIDRESDLLKLKEMILQLLLYMLTIGSRRVRRALLHHIPSLCMFLGMEMTNNDVLPHLITSLNERQDFQLRAEFLRTIIGVSVYVGTIAFVNFVLPCIEQALSDSDTYVIRHAIHSMTAAVDIGLISISHYTHLTMVFRPLLFHPSTYIRLSTVQLFTHMCMKAGIAHSTITVLQHLRPLLHHDVVDSTMHHLVHSLKAPMTSQELQLYIDEDNPGSTATTTSTSTAGGELSKNVEKQNKLSRIDTEVLEVLLPYIQRYTRSIKHSYTTSDVVSSASKSPSTSPLSHKVFLESIPVHYVHSLPNNAFLNSSQSRHRRGGSSITGSNSSTSTPLQSPLKPKRKRTLSLANEGNSIHMDQNMRIIEKALSLPLPPLQLGILNDATKSSTPFYLSDSIYLSSSADESADTKSFTPHVCINTLSEHRDSVKKLCVSRDNLFMCSGSIDGTIRIWDCSRLRLPSIHARSQLMYQMPLSSSSSSLSTSTTRQQQLVDMSILENSHSIAAAARKEIHVFKVEYAAPDTEMNSAAATGVASGSTNVHGSNLGTTESHRYIALSGVDKLRLDKTSMSTDNGSASRSITNLAHFNTLTESLLCYATSDNIISGWDIRSRDLQNHTFRLQQDRNMGTITQLCCGSIPSLLIYGTSKGYVVLMDLRFEIPVQQWRHSSRKSITLLQPHTQHNMLPVNTNTPTGTGASTSGNGAASASFTSASQHKVAGQSPLLFIGTEGSEQVAAFDIYTGQCKMCLNIDSSNIVHTNTNIPSSFSRATATIASTSTTAAFELPRLEPVNSTCIDNSESLLSSIKNHTKYKHFSSLLTCSGSYIMTAGSPPYITQWNLTQPAASHNYCFSSTGAANATYKFTSTTNDNNALIIQQTIQQPSNLSTHSHATPQPHTHTTLRLHNKQQVVDGHRGDVLDMVGVEYPQPTLCTAGRDGTIKVWVS